MTSRRKIVASWYSAAQFNLTKILQLINIVQERADNKINYFFFIGDDLKERKGKFSPENLKKALESSSITRFFNLNCYFRNTKGNNNFPPISIDFIRLGTSPDASFLFSISHDDIDEDSKIIDIFFTKVSQFKIFNYGFAHNEPSENHLAAYSAFGAYGPSMETMELFQGISDDFRDRPREFLPVVRGEAVRSIYPINMLSTKLFSSLQQILSTNELTQIGEFISLSEDKILWKVNDEPLRKSIYDILFKAGFVYEDAFINVDDLLPPGYSFTTYSSSLR